MSVLADRLRRLIAELYLDEAEFHQREGRAEQADECRRAAETWMALCGREVEQALHWEKSEENGCTVARATFGPYRLEVVNGANAVSWCIYHGHRLVRAGGGYTLFDQGLYEAERALRRLVWSGGCRRG